jgi:O-antigen/teichoic acid export membrane protein
MKPAANQSDFFSTLLVAGGLVNLAFAFVLAPRFLGKGMAVSVVLAEAAVCGILVCIVARTTKVFRRQNLDQVDVVSFGPVLIEQTRTNE